MKSINAARDRVMLLCARIELPSPLGLAKYVYKDVTQCSWAAADLPSFVVKVDTQRGSTYQYLDSNVTYKTTREILISLYVAHMCDESYTRDTDMIDLTEEAGQTVVDYFAKKRTLSMDYDGGVVESALIQRSTPPHTMATQGSTTKNRGIHFRMTVDFDNYAEPDDE